MRTAGSSAGLAETLWPRTRRRVLALLLLSPEREWHLREIARRTSASPAAAQREVARLAAVGILTRHAEAGRAYYRANPSCPIFDELRQILAKTMAVAGVLRDALLSLEDLQLAFVFGPAAQEDDGHSAVSVMVVSDASEAEIADRLAFAARRLGREIAPVIYAPEDFRHRLARRDRTLLRALSGPKIPVAGDPDAVAEGSGVGR
jgi:hypothetical protein